MLGNMCQIMVQIRLPRAAAIRTFLLIPLTSKNCGSRGSCPQELAPIGTLEGSERGAVSLLHDVSLPSLRRYLIGTSAAINPSFLPGQRTDFSFDLLLCSTFLCTDFSGSPLDSTFPAPSHLPSLSPYIFPSRLL
jgi:hypothetical protein